MKKLSLVLATAGILFHLVAPAQSRREERARERESRVSDRDRERNAASSTSMIEAEDGDAFFTNYTVPADFKKFPAIILAEKTRYDVLGKGINGPFTKKYHIKVAILEKTSLEDLATLYFDFDIKKGKDKLAIRILKKDGKEQIITGQDAIEYDKGNIPSIYRNRFSLSGEKNFKLAVPNLEVGDTLEFAYERKFNTSGVMFNTTQLPYHYELLSGKYPSVKQKLEFHLSKDYQLLAKSMYGAPKVVATESDSRRENVFVFEDNNRPGVDDERFLFEYREMPHIKYRVVSKASQGFEFINSEVDDVKSEVSKKDIIDRLNTLLQSDFRPQLTFELSKFKRNMRDVSNQDKIVENLYNYLRLAIHRLYAPAIDDEAFVNIMYKELESRDIKCSIVAVPNRSVTDKDGILLRGEMLFCIKYKDRLIYPVQMSTDWNAKHSGFIGQKGYVAVMDDRGKKVERLNDFEIPDISAEENVESSIYHVSVVTDTFEHLVVVDTSSFEGLSKRGYEIELLELLKKMEKVDKLNLTKEEIKEDEEESKRRNTARREEAKRKKDEAKKSAAEELKDNIKEGLEQHYDNVVSVDTFYHVQTGTEPGKPVLMDTKTYTLGEMSKKVGNSYFVSLGKIIGSQIEIKNNEKKREHNIYIDYPKVLKNTVYFNVPEGYRAEGLENFTFNVNNEAGKFESSAKMENSKVVLTTTKVYKKGYMDKTQWKNLTEMLDAAFNLTQKQIVLKKN